MKQFVIIFFLLPCCLLSAQIGLNLRYALNQAENWRLENVLTGQATENLYNNGPNLGFDYWFRLKNKRVEFLPELGYSNYKTKLSSGTNLTWANVEFQFNTNFYLFDFKNDCNCPTFSKQGSDFMKGFYLQLSPGVAYFSQQINSEMEKIKSTAFTWSVGAGVGLDIGISDLFTLSPNITARYYAPSDWQGLSTSNVDGGIKETEVIDETSSLLRIMPGLRIGFRFTK